MTVGHVNSRSAVRGYSNDLLVRAGLFVSVFLLYSSVLPFATTTFGIPATPAYVAIVLVAAVLCSGLVTARPTQPATKFVLAMLMAYLALTMAQAIVVPPTVPDVLKFRVLWAVVTASAIIVLQNTKERDLIWGMRLVVIFSVLVIFLEYGSRFSLPLKMSTVVGRAAGLYMNPNAAAFFLCAAIPIVTLRARVVVRVAWYLAIGIATQLTFSRGGVLLWIAMVVVTETFSFSSSKTKNYGQKILLMALMALTLYTLYNLFIESAQTFLASTLDENTANRLRFGANDSSQIRIYIIERAIDVVQGSIVFGKGIGFGYSWGENISVHNIFVLVLLEQGLLGILWLTVLLIALMSLPRPIGVWVATTIIVGGMFNHNLFDSPTYGLVMAIYAALPSVLHARQGQITL